MDFDYKTTFEQYEEKNAAVIEAKKVLEAAEKDRSDIVKKLYEAIAPEKQLTYKGKKITLVNRDDTYFMRESKASKIVID